MKTILRHNPTFKHFRPGAARWLIVLICGGAFGLGLGGCEQNHDDPPTVNISGAWRTTTWISVYVPGSGANVVWSLAQIGSAIAGTFVDNLNRGGAIEGSISAEKVFLTFNYTNNANWIVTFEATPGTNLMSGVFRGEGEVKFGDAQRLLTQ